jgi:PAS domain S-box-containing protein
MRSARTLAAVIAGSDEAIVSMDAPVPDRQDEALRDSEERFRSVFESAAVGIGRVALDGRFLEVNEAYARIAGYGRDELLGLSFGDITHPDDLAVDVDLRARLCSGRIASYQREKRYLRKDGEIVWVSLSVGVALDSSGRPAYCSVVVEDVTARKRAEEALREREELLRLCVDHAPAAVAMFDREMRYLVASRRFLSDFKLSPEDVLGRCHYDVFPEVPERWKEIHRRCLAGAVEACEEEAFPRADGTVDWVRWGIHPWHTAAGEVGGIILFTELVTERKRAIEALRLTEERFRLLVQGVKDCAIYMLAPDGTVTSWSAAAEQMFGYSEEEIVGQHRRVFFADEDVAAGRVEGDLAAAVATGHAEVEIWRVRKDGSRFWGNVQLTALRDDRGRMRGFANVTRDFTERKRSETALREGAERLRVSEAALRAADSEKDRFLAVLSHELRNPLAPIRNCLYILDHAVPGGEQARRALAIIHRQIRQMTSLIDDLLDVTRIANGKIRLRRERVDLDELARRTVEDHRAVFDKSHVRLEVLPAGAEVWVDGDRVRLTQIIGNLLQNAAKFTPPGGKATVVVEASRERAEAVVSVRDDGSGIPPEVLPGLFAAFAQADTTLDRSKGGLGLGLALVKDLVEMHGGSVSAASEGEGKGSTFTVTLPLDVPVDRPEGLLPPGRDAVECVLAEAAAARQPTWS